MADIQRLINDRLYLRSVLIHINGKLKTAKNTSVYIDKDFVLADETKEEHIDAFQLDRRGDDFDTSSIYYHESTIINVLKYITKKYEVQTVEQMRFNYFENWTYGKYKILNKNKDAGGNMDLIVIGFVINNKIFELTYIKHYIASCHFSEQEYLTRDNELEYKIKNKFPKTPESIANAKLRMECNTVLKVKN